MTDKLLAAIIIGIGLFLLLLAIFLLFGHYLFPYSFFSTMFESESAIQNRIYISVGLLVAAGIVIAIGIQYPSIVSDMSVIVPRSPFLRMVYLSSVYSMRILLPISLGIIFLIFHPKINAYYISIVNLYPLTVNGTC